MPDSARGVTLFAGPTLQGLPVARWQRQGLDLRGPARRGSIAQLAAERAPGVLVLCDGVFQSEPAVSHAELCAALDRGWRIWGVSSIGAIRAHELRFEGMQGHGWVYAQFARHADFTDDELCLLHLPAPGYEPVTEALVNLRYALSCRGAALGIGPRQQRVLLDELRRLWFGARTPERIEQILLGPAGVPPAAARRLLAGLRRERVKSLDLLSLMRLRPWAR